MAKRFTDTNIWKNQKWFKKLTPIYKLFWKYLTDSSDHAGIWKIDFTAITEDLGVEDFNIEDFITSCNSDNDKLNGKPIARDRIKLISGTHLWITGFIQYQYENKAGLINAKSLVVKSALEILQSHNILSFAIEKGYVRTLEPLEGPLSPFKPLEGVKDKVKDNSIQEVEESKVSNGLCHEMLRVFKESNPSYQNDNDDLRFLLEVAYKIAAMNRWSKQSVVEENKQPVVDQWRTIVHRIRGDTFYGSKDIAFLNRDWKSLIMKISQPYKQKKGIEV